MITKAWNFFALCSAPYVKGSLADNDTCTVANAEYVESIVLEQGAIYQAVQNLTAIFSQTVDGNASHLTAKAQQAVDELCPHFNLSAQAVENVINRCAGQCPNRVIHRVGADVYRAAAKFCEHVRIEEYMEHIRALVPCYVALHSHPAFYQNSEANVRLRQRIFWLDLTNDGECADENTTAPCGVAVGRRCACRGTQTDVQFETTRPGAHIRDVCGQKAHELLLYLLNRAMDALNCSEFGDYVRDYGWLKINYRANPKPATNQ